jgi:hypothetical protein
MALPDTISITEVVVLDTVTVSPVEEINSVSVNTIQDVDVVSIDTTDSVTSVVLTDNAPDLAIQISNVETTAMVQSVNGKIGHVVIDYPDINASPVNHVKYVHNQTTVSNDWTINHNLGFFPNVTILDNDSPPRIVEADIRYLNTSSVRIIMNTSMSGTAYLT